MSNIVFFLFFKLCLNVKWRRDMLPNTIVNEAFLQDSYIATSGEFAMLIRTDFLFQKGRL